MVKVSYQCCGATRRRLLYLWSVKLVEFIPIVGLKTKVSRFVQSKAQTVHRRDLWLIKTIKKSLLAPQNGGETAGIDMQRRICHPMCFLLSSVVSICWLSIVLLHFVHVSRGLSRALRWVCLSVRLLAYLGNREFKLHWIFHARSCLRPWVGPPPAALRYVMYTSGFADDVAVALHVN